MGARAVAPAAVTDPATMSTCLGLKESVSTLSIPRTRMRMPATRTLPATLTLSAEAMAAVMMGALPSSGNLVSTRMPWASTATGPPSDRLEAPSSA
jgi:hypothetical protein